MTFADAFSKRYDWASERFEATHEHEDLPPDDAEGCWCYDMGTDTKAWFFPIRAALWYGPERGWEPVKEKK